ncbi:ROK family protein [Aeromicrobium sp. CF4.19]|uniref:ROK family protein n=1 Tax=Aeromicrobium sp. CF4.19 TaxID=3373082 RepID=UPI003EE53069
MTTGPTPGASGAGELLQHLRDGRARTKAELAELSSLARSTISTRLDALVASGLLRPVGEAASTGGRPPTRFALDGSARAVLGVDLGASHTAVAVIDLSGTVRAETSVASDIAEGPEPVLDRVAELARGLLADLGLDTTDVVGIGIGVPGPVEHSTGRPMHPPIMPGWHEFDVPAHLNQHFAGPVLVDNDVNVLALGEHAGPWATEEHLLYVKVATGIGAGIVSHRRLVRGAVGTAGDLGHVRIVEVDEAVVCRCGNTGCLEAVAAGPAVARALRESGVEASTSQDVVDAVRGGDASAGRAVREAGRAIGGVLAMCVNLLNPSVIVIGGTLSTAGDQLVAGVREVIYQRSLPLATKDLRVVTASEGDRAALVGAGALVLDEVLSAQSVDQLVSRGALHATG